METGIIIFLAALFGLLIGSFLNVVIYRLPIMLDKAWTAAARQQLNLEVEEQAKFNLLTPPIYRNKGRFSNLTIGFCGDLLYGRTVHSLTKTMGR